LGPRIGLNAVVRRKIPIPYRDWNPPIVLLVAQCYTTELSGLFKEKGVLDINYK
jgi:hypothetical protein